MTLACKVCTSKDVDEDVEVNKKLVVRVLAMGHMSIAEHVQTTWLIKGVSRALTHQLVRHRLCTFSQQSQRYVEFDSADFYVPDTCQSEQVKDIFDETFTYLKKQYRKLRKLNVKKEDARFLLPNATKNNIIMSCNLRQLMHVLNMRLCVRAQAEIRELANRMRLIMIDKFPELEPFFGAKCEVINEQCFEKCEWDGKLCKDPVRLKVVEGG